MSLKNKCLINTDRYILFNFVSVKTQKSVKQLPPTIVDEDEGTRASFPLGIKHATNYAAPRLALIG
jgi:2-polyprenyl-6-methoxyphenol hydroxylase-like FAD-dependent oxidoreductase